MDWTTPTLPSATKLDAAGATARPTLSDLSRKAPESVVAAVTSALQLAADDAAKAPFVARAVVAVTRFAEHATSRALLDAAGATSDAGVLLHALEAPDALIHADEADPLFAARRRGLVARQRLLTAEGGVCSATELGQLLGDLTRQAIDKRRQRGKLIGLDVGRHGYRYPAWQAFQGTTLPGLEPVLGALAEADAWTQVAFMVNPNSWLGGESPLALLRRGDRARVISAAELFAG